MTALDEGREAAPDEAPGEATKDEAAVADMLALRERRRAEKANGTRPDPYAGTGEQGPPGRGRGGRRGKATESMSYQRVPGADGTDRWIGHSNELPPILDPGADARELDGRRRIESGPGALLVQRLRDEIGRNALSGMLRRGPEVVWVPAITENGWEPDKPAEGPADPHAVVPLNAERFIAVAKARHSFGEARTEKVDHPELGRKIEVELWTPGHVADWVFRDAFNAAATGLTPNLRALTGTTRTPLVRPDGGLLVEPGYDPVTGLLHLPDPGLVLPPIPEHPTPAELRAAFETFLYPVSLFPFESADHRANWCGMALIPALVALFPGPYPMHISDAPKRGHGKTKLIEILIALYGGRLRPPPPFGNGDEVRKQITSILRAIEPVICWDNVRGTVNSPHLEALLTTGMWGDRLLGGNDDLLLPNNKLWTMTSNNATLGGDALRRSVWFRLDSDTAYAERRTFAFEPVSWVRANRGQYLAAILTMVRAWQAAGAPMPAEAPSDNYVEIVQAIRGILGVARAAFDEDPLGLPIGLYASVESKVQEETDEDSQWDHFTLEIYQHVGNNEFTAGQIVDLISDAEKSGTPGNGFVSPVRRQIDPELLPKVLEDDWGKKSKHSFVITLGRHLGWRKGTKTKHDLKIVLTRTRSNKAHYRVEGTPVYGAEAPTAEEVAVSAGLAADHDPWASA